jgi:ribosome maturation factor RimP
VYYGRFLLGVGTQNVGFAPTFYFGKKRVVNRTKVVERIKEIASEVTVSNSLELVHVELAGSGKRQTVRVFIDKEQGITHDDCSLVSSEIEKTLDAEDFIRDSYVLEVSSPGIERGLYNLSDFEKFAGETAKLKTFRPINGQKNYHGEILGVDGENILLNDRTNGNLKILFEDVSKANLSVDFKKELKKAKRRP